MKNLTATICVTITVLLGSAGVSWSADFQKGVTAYKDGGYAFISHDLRKTTLDAEQGDDLAQYLLGSMYGTGEGVPQDYKTAVKWYRLAAEQGETSAQYNLGVMYDNGQGIIQDYKTAVKLYRLAAERGNAGAQGNLGGMYGNGKGVIQDNVYAHLWWNIAASSGNKDAVTNRDIVAGKMTSADISAAQKLARECVAKNYKGC